MKVFCNPLMLPLKYQKEPKSQFLFREAADPTVVFWKDRYYLFASMTGGAYVSDDLVDWTFIRIPALPPCDYAPTVMVIGDRLFHCASKRETPSPIFVTDDPDLARWKEISAPFACWDPALFADDDGRVYLYWGCSAKEPIYGIELDPVRMEPIGKKVPLIAPDNGLKGFEIRGENNIYESKGSFMKLIGMDDTFVEGAWMNKIDGCYYLQYANPATETNVYNDAVYRSDRPLGPYTLQPHNPFSMKAGGFITGAGHGCTFADRYGNLWHMTSMRISVNHQFERRLGLFPAAVDEDGTLYCNLRFGDFPKRMPTERMTSPYDSDPGWRLLSRHATVQATSERPGNEAKHLVAENIRACWMPANDDVEPSCEIMLKQDSFVHAVQISIADRLVAAPDRDYAYEGASHALRALIDPERPHFITLSVRTKDGRTTVFEQSVKTPETLFHFEVPLLTTAFDLKVSGGSFGAPLALSGFRAFGVASGPKPDIPQIVVERTDRNSARITWSSSRGAFGYEVRWGVKPDRLYLSWLVDDALSLQLHSLVRDFEYHFAVVAYNAVGETTSAIARMM